MQGPTNEMPMPEAGGGEDPTSAITSTEPKAEKKGDGEKDEQNLEGLEGLMAIVNEGVEKSKEQANPLQDAKPPGNSKGGGDDPMSMMKGKDGDAFGKMSKGMNSGGGGGAEELVTEVASNPEVIAMVA